MADPSSDRLLQLIETLAAPGPLTRPEPMDRYLNFRVEEERYCLPEEALEEVALQVYIQPVPLAPPPFLGVSYRRRTVVPVVSFQKHENPSYKPFHADVVFLFCGGFRVGILAEEIGGMSVFPQGSAVIQPSKNGSATSIPIRGCLTASDGIESGVINLEALGELLDRTAPF